MEKSTKSKTLTFVCTPECLETLNALVHLRQLRGEKTPDGRWTASRILTVAVDDYFDKHKSEIEQAMSIQNIVNFK